MTDAEPEVRFTLTMPESMADVLTGLAYYCRCSKGEAVCRALALLKIYVDAHRAGHRVVVVDGEGDEVAEWVGVVDEVVSESSEGGAP